MQDGASFGRALAGLRYEFLSLLGEGGFGAVIKARHTVLGRVVALKILHPFAAGNLEEARARMELEARAMAKLDGHPNIVRIHDSGFTSDGRSFVAMDYLEGRSLDQEVAARGPLPPLEAIDVTLEVLSALSAAHEIGLVHRDIKPQNIFLSRGADGRRVVKLLDFGIAKVVQGDGSKTSQVQSIAKGTAAGSILGSPQYFSPEQARGKLHLIDARADLYAVGGTLYKMVSGLGPFETREGGQTPFALIAAHGSMPAVAPSVRTGVPVPPEVDAIVLKALSKPREARHQTATEFATELRAIGELIRTGKGASGTDRIVPEAVPVEPYAANAAAFQRFGTIYPTGMRPGAQAARRGVRVARLLGLIMTLALAVAAIWYWRHLRG